MKRQETNNKQQNQRLHSFREKIKQGYDTLLLQFGAVTTELLKNHLQDIGANPTILLALIREELSIVQSTRVSSTYQSCYSYQGQLESFVRSKGIAEISLELSQCIFSMIIASTSSEKAIPCPQQNKISFG